MKRMSYTDDDETAGLRAGLETNETNYEFLASTHGTKMGYEGTKTCSQRQLCFFSLSDLLNI